MPYIKLQGLCLSPSRRVRSVLSSGVSTLLIIHFFGVYDMASFRDIPEFDNPITNLLEGEDSSILTENARQLLEGDLYALAWKNNTVRTDKLNVRDLNSIEEAFRKHSLYGSSNSPVVGGACCCCTCTPACCCTAVAVLRAA